MLHIFKYVLKHLPFFHMSKYNKGAGNVIQKAFDLPLYGDFYTITTDDKWIGVFTLQCLMNLFKDSDLYKERHEIYVQKSAFRYNN